MKLNTTETEEYFLNRFKSKSPKAKCKDIFDCFLAYGYALDKAEQTTSKKQLEKLDDTAEINFRLACKELSMLSEDELTIYLNYLKDHLTRDFASASETQMLGMRMEYSRLLRHIPKTLSPEQQSIRDDIQAMIYNYYVKMDNEM